MSRPQHMALWKRPACWMRGHDMASYLWQWSFCRRCGKEYEI